MTKALLIDDEKRMLDLLTLYLEPHSYTCRKAQSPGEALTYLAKETFDIILLDIMMPEMNGFELCEKIREVSNVPIIMLTARDQHQDVVKGLNVGADDYITKPFYEKELIARMTALLRRVSPKQTLELNGLSWDKDQFEVIYDKNTIKLTPKEFAILGLLMQHPNRVFSREQLLDLIWGYDAETDGRTIDSHIRNMREKIRQTGFPIDDCIVTVWSVGYKWLNLEPNQKNSTRAK
ncbi:response regulator transcription factor [Planococcus lenghuensis]|uniref:DNA-binding response regulator n=1 Tax=Planococcus lenghuensis TaxID=2213202 RepID=A0A1Q2L4E7_9BACL|nr:response regulator transcription factor [Planococcus lenghuensis]AQQ55293.1 DNA-binding response regulator [Planococcus lenghuensis]